MGYEMAGGPVEVILDALSEMPAIGRSKRCVQVAFYIAC